MLYFCTMYPSKTYTVDEALKRLEHYCSYQERCHKDVNQKLIKMKMIPEARDHIIGHLLKHNFLNEERYARAYARGKFRMKKWGKQRIQRELKFKDINNTIISLALKEIGDDYLQTFNDLSAKKLNSIRENNPQKKRKKLADFLLYRGWESQLVYDRIRELIP